MYGFLASACLTAMYLAAAMFDNERRSINVMKTKFSLFLVKSYKGFPCAHQPFPIRTCHGAKIRAPEAAPRPAVEAASPLSVWCTGGCQHHLQARLCHRWAGMHNPFDHPLLVGRHIVVWRLLEAPLRSPRGREWSTARHTPVLHSRQAGRASRGIEKDEGREHREWSRKTIKK